MKLDESSAVKERSTIDLTNDKEETLDKKNGCGCRDDDDDDDDGDDDH